MNKLTHVSLFSGIGGLDLAAIVGVPDLSICSRT